MMLVDLSISELACVSDSDLNLRFHENVEGEEWSNQALSERPMLEAPTIPILPFS